MGILCEFVIFQLVKNENKLDCANHYRTGLAWQLSTKAWVTSHPNTKLPGWTTVPTNLRA